LNEYIVLMCH